MTIPYRKASPELKAAWSDWKAVSEGQGRLCAFAAGWNAAMCNITALAAIAVLEAFGYEVKVTKRFYLKWHSITAELVIPYDYEPTCGMSFEEYKQDRIAFGQSRGGTYLCEATEAESKQPPKIVGTVV